MHILNPMIKNKRQWILNKIFKKFIQNEFLKFKQIKPMENLCKIITMNLKKNFIEFVIKNA